MSIIRVPLIFFTVGACDAEDADGGCIGDDASFHLLRAARDAAAFRLLLLRVVLGPGRWLA